MRNHPREATRRKKAANERAVLWWRAKPTLVSSRNPSLTQGSKFAVEFGSLREDGARMLNKECVVRPVLGNALRERITMLVTRFPGQLAPGHDDPTPTDAQAEDAFRSIIRWIGEDPDRDGLQETPKRLVRAFREYFCGYVEDPEQILRKTFEEVDGYDEMIVLRGVAFTSHCEHHVAPIVGRAWVGYVPDRRVVGISKLARVVEAYAKRLQIQERMTAQIANTIESVLKPRGVAVVVKATHHCMVSRGVQKRGTDLVTSRMLGCFRDYPMTRGEFLSMVNSEVEA
jgi:GTP cyclohydrolase IA